MKICLLILCSVGGSFDTEHDLKQRQHWCAYRLVQINLAKSGNGYQANSIFEASLSLPFSSLSEITSIVLWQL